MLLLPSKFFKIYFFLYTLRDLVRSPWRFYQNCQRWNRWATSGKFDNAKKTRTENENEQKKKKILLCHLRCWKTRTLFRAKHRVLLNLALGTMRNRLSRPRSTGCTRATWQVAQRCGKNQTDQHHYRATDSRGAHFWQPLHLSAPTWRLNASHVTVKKAKFFNHSRFS